MYKKLMVVSLIMGTVMAGVQNPTYEISEMYRYAFGIYGPEFSNVTIDLLQRCSRRHPRYDDRDCWKGEMLFDNLVRACEHKAQKGLDEGSIEALWWMSYTYPAYTHELKSRLKNY